ISNAWLPTDLFKGSIKYSLRHPSRPGKATQVIDAASEIGMNFEFTGEQQQLRASLRSYLARHCAFEERRSVQSDSTLEGKIWKDLAERLGVLGASIPEAAGGL